VLGFHLVRFQAGQSFNSQLFARQQQ